MTENKIHLQIPALAVVIVCATYIRAVVDSQGLQCPGEAESHQDVKHIASDGVGHCHVSHSCTDRHTGCSKAAEKRRDRKRKGQRDSMTGKECGQLRLTDTEAGQQR